MDIPYIDAQTINSYTEYPSLISTLKKAFKENSIITPMRHHHDFPNHKVGEDSTLLLMPAWNSSKEAGVKIVTVSPKNSQFNLPSIHGTYIYIDALNGCIKALMEAKSLTSKRTAAASALASSYLSKKDSSSLLMIGTGALSKNLILAHASIRPITKVFVWGRDFNKAKTICNNLADYSFEINPVKTITEVISEVDIISCATLSKEPLVFGKHLKNGQHLDLVGAYRKNMREADDECIKKSSVFIDTYQGGLKESGDIAIPLQNGVLKEHDIKADLFELCNNRKEGRTSNKQITFFKSVGHAIEDLAAANYYYNKHFKDA